MHMQMPSQGGSATHIHEVALLPQMLLAWGLHHGGQTQVLLLFAETCSIQ